MNASFTFNPADGKFYNGTTALSNYAPELTYGEKPTWSLTLKGQSVAGVSSWLCAIDVDLKKSDDVMARTDEGITCDTSGTDPVLTIPLDTVTTRFLGVCNGRASTPCHFGLYGIDSDGVQVLYVTFLVDCRFTVDAGNAGTVEPIKVTSLTLPQMDARYQKKGEGAEAKWGDITGDLEDQTDLKEELDGKATATDISTAVTTHDTSATAHNDIRTEVAGKATSSDIYTAVATHDSSATAHSDIRAEVAGKMPKSGGTFTGNVIINNSDGNNKSFTLKSPSANLSAITSNGYSLTIGRGMNVSNCGWGSICVGSNFTLTYNCIFYGCAFGSDLDLRNAGTNAHIFGHYNKQTDSKFVYGQGDSTTRWNALEITPNGMIRHGVKEIPASTSAFSPNEGTYKQTPTAQPTYTLPTVSNTTVTHAISLRVHFSADMTSAPVFISPDGSTVITPKGTYTITATRIVEYLCEYDSVAGWVIYALEVA